MLQVSCYLPLSLRQALALTKFRTAGQPRDCACRSPSASRTHTSALLR